MVWLTYIQADIQNPTRMFYQPARRRVADPAGKLSKQQHSYEDAIKKTTKHKAPKNACGQLQTHPRMAKMSNFRIGKRFCKIITNLQ
eukprot:4395980-Amphidinium_carterae.1